MKTELIIQHPRRARKWGWNYNTNPIQTGSGLAVPYPEQPRYRGTLRQVLDQIHCDRTYQSLGTADRATRWFYDGHYVAGFRVGTHVLEFDLSSVRFHTDEFQTPLTIIIYKEESNGTGT